MEYFNQSEKEFLQNQETCSQFLGSYKDNVDQSEVLRIQRALTQSDKSLQSMEKEANHFKDKEQQNKLQKIKKYRNQYLEIRNSFYKFENDYNLKKNKQALLNQQQRSQDPSMSQRDKILNQGELLKSQNSRLQETTILANETQNTVIQIQQELLKNTESIHRMNSKSKDTQKDLKSGDQILNDMTRRLVTNKIILVLIIIVLFLLIIIILYLKLKKYIPIGVL